MKPLPAGISAPYFNPLLICLIGGICFPLFVRGGDSHPFPSFFPSDKS